MAPEAVISSHRQARLDPTKRRLPGLGLYAYAQPLYGVCLWPDGLPVLLCPGEPCRAVWAGAMGHLGAAEKQYRRGAGAGIAQTSRPALSGVYVLGHRPVPAGRGVCMSDAALLDSAAISSHRLARGTDALAAGTARFCSARRTAVCHAECEHRDRPPGGTSTFYTLRRPLLSDA